MDAMLTVLLFVPILAVLCLANLSHHRASRAISAANAR
jgi:hypothetical protein